VSSSVERERFTYTDPDGNIRDETSAVVAWADSLDMADGEGYYADVPPVGAGGQPPKPDEPESPADEDEQEGTGTSRLGVILTRSQLSSLPAVETLIERVVGFPAAVLVVGSTGVGKTFTVVAFGCCVATGRNWLGHRVVRRRVLLVIGEGAFGLDQRITAWEQAWNGGVPVGDHWLTIIVKPRTLHDPATWSELAAYAVSGGYGLVVLDTFSSLAPDSDETKDAAQIMRRLSDLATAINGTAMLIHHPGWSDSGRARGGSQLEANADEILILREVTEGSDLFTMTRKKVKDGPAGEIHWLRRSLSHGSVIIEGARSNDASVPLRARIMAVLTNYGGRGATGPELIEEIAPESKSGFYSALNKLIREGVVREEGVQSRKRYYALTSEFPDCGTESTASPL
jgi:hypothetical protein